MDDLNTLPSQPPSGPPTVSIPSMSSEEQTKLHAHYDKLWDEVDKATEHQKETPPSVPTAEPEPEHVEAHQKPEAPEHQTEEPKPNAEESAKPRKSRKPEAKAPSIDIIDEPVSKKEDVPVDANDPIEKLELHPEAKPEQKSHFKNVKEAYRAKRQNSKRRKRVWKSIKKSSRN